jgi:hypothetical protein
LDLIQPDQSDFGTSSLIVIQARQIAIVVPRLAGLSGIDIRSHCTAKESWRNHEQNKAFHLNTDHRTGKDLNIGLQVTGVVAGVNSRLNKFVPVARAILLCRAPVLSPASVSKESSRCR